MNVNKINELKDGFLKSLRANEKSKKTIERYQAGVKKFLTYIETEFDEGFKLEDITPMTLERFKVYLSELTYINKGKEKRYAPTTRNGILSSVKEFFKYLKKHEIISSDPTKELVRINEGNKTAKHLNLDKAKELLSSAEGKFKERDRAMLSIFLNLGLRVSELHKLKVEDIDFKDQKVLIHGKGDKERVLYINDSCIKDIKQYIKVRIGYSKSLFLNSRNETLSIRGIQTIIKKYLEGINKSDLSVHSLRHTAASLSYSGDPNIKALQQMLGHSDMSTTANIYTHLCNTEMKDMVNSNPLNQ